MMHVSFPFVESVVVSFWLYDNSNNMPDWRKMIWNRLVKKINYLLLLIIKFLVEKSYRVRGNGINNEK
jgi:hypothetical protein